MGQVPLRYAGQHSYVGLREQPVDAVHRYNLSFPVGVTTESHVLLEVTFTAEGLARYCTEVTDAADGFAPRLAKRVYTDTSRDWGAWHFMGGLPLNEPKEIMHVWRDLTASDMV